MDIIKKIDLKEIIASLPVLIFILYLMGFITVNLYFFNLGIEGIEPINLNYLIIGFFDLAVILLPVVSLVLCFYGGRGGFNLSDLIWKEITIYTITFFALLFCEINTFFYYDQIPTAFIFLSIGFILFGLIHVNKNMILIKVYISCLLISILVLIYSVITSRGEIRGFIVDNLLIGVFGIGIILVKNLSKLIRIKTLAVKLIFAVLLLLAISAILFNNSFFVSDLRINIGGLKPTTAKIYLEQDCFFNTKDSFSTEFKLNNHEIVQILYNSNEKLIVDSDSTVIILEMKCIKAIKKGKY